MWNQVYDPFDSAVLSTLAAALPVVSLLVLIASGKVKAHYAAVIALVVAILVAIFLFTMPAGLALRAAVLGAVAGFFPIGWIVLNVIFLYRLTVATGAFGTLSQAIGGVTRDRRLQLLLDRVFLRRILRRRLRLRHAGRRDGRDPDRSRLLAAGRVRSVADRQHRAGRLRRARHADRRACERDRHRSLFARRHGRPAIAVLLADRAVLADLGVRRLARHVGDLAGDPCLRSSRLRSRNS